MKRVIGLEAEYNDTLSDWGLKLRYLRSEAPDVLQVKYKRFTDLGTLFAFILTLSGDDE